LVAGETVESGDAGMEKGEAGKFWFAGQPPIKPLFQILAASDAADFVSVCRVPVKMFLKNPADRLKFRESKIL
jgi:hypothetical protein